MLLLNLSGAFSILKRIVMGETTQVCWITLAVVPFSILKRIVMGETSRRAPLLYDVARRFQYPQADRDG